MIGHTISHYHILDKLGEGGMGVVYKAHDTTLDRVVALKFLPNYLTSDATEKERFYHEARAASSLNHPNATTIHEIAEHDGRLYIAMEYVEGKTLKQLVAGEILPIKKVLDVAIQACEGLSAAHEKGVVHRDIKSDNIMLTSKGQVKVMDFGLAKVKGATKLTKAGSTIGTAAYMSPEQAQGEEVDARSDIFSFGVVLYELLAGKLPFRGEHQAAMMYSLVNEDPQPIARFNDAVSPEMERIVLKALMKEKEERYQHIDDMLADLRRERKGIEYARAGYTRTGTMPLPPPPPVSRKRAPVQWFAAAAAVIALVAGAFVFNPFSVRLPTQQPAAAAPEKPSIAVLYFQNIVDPADKAHTGDMLADLLITSLSQSGDLDVISRERLFDIQKELQADAKSITPELASKVAERAGVSAMLLGSVVQEEPELMVTTRLIDVKSGKILTSQRVSGFTSAQIFRLVDTLALLVRNQFGGFPRGGQEPKSVAEVTTSSPEAYRSFIAGVDANQKFYYDEAIAAFKKAIELDPNFAMAYYALGNAAGGVTEAERREALMKASSLGSRVTEREQMLLRSSYAEFVDRDRAKAIAILQEFVARYPKETYPYIRLTVLQSDHGDNEGAVRTVEQGLAADSLDKNLWNMRAYGCAILGRKQEALRSVGRYLELAPAEPNPYDTRGDLGIFLGEPDSAVVWWKKALAFRASYSSSQKLAFQYLVRDDYANFGTYLRQYAASQQQEEQPLWLEYIPALEAEHRGKLRLAFDLSVASLKSHRRVMNAETLASYFYALVELSVGRGDFGVAVAYAESLALKGEKEKITIGSAQSDLAYIYLVAGKGELADKTMKSAESGLGRMDRQATGSLEYTKGLFAAARGDHAGAVAHYDAALRVAYPNHAPQFHRGISLLKSGNAAGAVEEFTRCTWYSPIRSNGFDADFLPFAGCWPSFSVRAHYWLGAAYEQQGNTRRAIQEYRLFLDRWKDADFKSAEIDDARLRLAKLGAS